MRSLNSQLPISKNGSVVSLNACEMECKVSSQVDSETDETLCDQLGVSDKNMENHLKNSRWSGLIGDRVYRSYLRRRKIQDYYFVTLSL